jgi:cytochrome c
MAALTVAILAVGSASPVPAEHVSSSEPMAAEHGPRLVMPIMNAERGKKLFVDKGCVACHAVNGVGGHDAPSMDAHKMNGLMNPFDFAAKMWNHAPGMIAAQEGAFGDQVLFTGDELADIIAFVHDDRTQHTFNERDLTAQARKMMDHEHGAMPAPKAHAKEVGHHPHAAGTKPHKD